MSGSSLTLSPFETEIALAGKTLSVPIPEHERTRGSPCSRAGEGGQLRHTMMGEHM